MTRGDRREGIGGGLWSGFPSRTEANLLGSSCLSTLTLWLPRWPEDLSWNIFSTHIKDGLQRPWHQFPASNVRELQCGQRFPLI